MSEGHLSVRIGIYVDSTLCGVLALLHDRAPSFGITWR
jgi:hypothetical protein